MYLTSTLLRIFHFFLIAWNISICLFLHNKIVFFLHRMKGNWSCSVMSLCDPMDYSLPGSSIHGIFQARILKCCFVCYYFQKKKKKKNTGVCCHFLLQGIFPTQGSNLHLLHLLHWQADFFTTSHHLGKWHNQLKYESIKDTLESSYMFATLN